MKLRQKAKTSFNPTESKALTLGDLISATYSECGKREAVKILKLAMAANFIHYTRPRYLG
jgi:hypothetical protein